MVEEKNVWERWRSFTHVGKGKVWTLRSCDGCGALQWRVQIENVRILRPELVKSEWGEAGNQHREFAYIHAYQTLMFITFPLFYAHTGLFFRRCSEKSPPQGICLTSMNLWTTQRLRKIVDILLIEKIYRNEMENVNAKQLSWIRYNAHQKKKEED